MIKIGSGLLDRLGAEVRPLGLGRRCAVITDDRVGPIYAARVERSLADAGFETITVTVPAGEKSKRLEMVARCYDHLAKHRIERKSFVVALGGGAGKPVVHPAPTTAARAPSAATHAARGRAPTWSR